MRDFREGEGSDKYRHQCMVRHVLKMREKDRNEALVFLARWDEKHPGSILSRDVKTQWARGNRGVHGTWFDDPTPVAPVAEHILQDGQGENPDQRRRPGVQKAGSARSDGAKGKQVSLFQD